MIAPAFVDHKLPTLNIAKTRLRKVVGKLRDAAAVMRAEQGSDNWPNGEYLFHLWTETLWRNGYRPPPTSSNDSSPDWTADRAGWNTVATMLSDVADVVVARSSNPFDIRRTHPSREAAFDLFQLAYMYRRHTGGEIGRNPEGPAGRFCAAALAHLGRPGFTKAQWDFSIKVGRASPLWGIKTP